MSISCTCDIDGGDGADWYWQPSSAPKPLETIRSRKCCSCKTKLKPGDMAQVLYRWREPGNDIEERIHGGEVPMTAWHRCPYCTALTEIVENHGACYAVDRNIQNQLIEHITDGEPCEDGQDPATVLLHDLFEKFAVVDLPDEMRLYADCT